MAGRAPALARDHYARPPPTIRWPRLIIAITIHRVWSANDLISSGAEQKHIVLFCPGARSWFKLNYPFRRGIKIGGNTYPAEPGTEA